MEIYEPQQLIARLRELPEAAPLLDRIGDHPGVHLVGGAVRDLLLDRPPLDLDLVVEGDAAALARQLGPAFVHDRFGTSTVVLDGYRYDIARARTEIYPRPGALPEVTPASLDQDLQRRDFTVNALAIPLAGADAGAVRAPAHGLEDLEARVLRVFHDHSFLDDPTRLLRLVRYASRLRFAVEPHTLALARDAARSGALTTVSGPRIGTELRLMAREPGAIAAFELLAEHGFDAALAPRFGLTDPALARRAAALLPEDGRGEVLVLSLASRGLAPAALRSLLDSLAFEAGERDAVVAAAIEAPALADALGRAGSPSEIAAAARVAGPELVAIAGALGPEAAAREWLGRLRRVTLEIDGDDLRAAGVPQGPKVGAGLRAALAAKLDGRVSGREQELAEALRSAGASG